MILHCTCGTSGRLQPLQHRWHIHNLVDMLSLQHFHCFLDLLNRWHLPLHDNGNVELTVWMVGTYLCISTGTSTCLVAWMFGFFLFSMFFVIMGSSTSTVGDVLDMRVRNLQCNFLEPS